MTKFEEALGQMLYVSCSMDCKNNNNHVPMGKERMDKFISSVKDENTKLGDACKTFVQEGFKANKMDEVKMQLTKLFDDSYELDKWDEEPNYGDVKEIIRMYSPDTDSAEKVSVSQNEGNALVEIQHLKHLMDIMERNIQGKMTEQDAIELKEIGNKDIEKLKQMIGTLNN